MRLSLAFILITVGIDAMGIGLILPIMPALITEVQGGTLSDAALWGGVLSASFAVMQFLFGPVLGNLSDAYGRRPVLLVSLAVMTLDYLVMALAGSIWLLLLGRIVGGITAATHSTAGAYMADISAPEEKAARFGLLGAALGLGFVAGPVLGGLLGELGTRAPFYAAALLAGLNFLLGFFVMRETVPADGRRPFQWRQAGPLGAFRALGRLPGIRPLLSVYFLYSVAVYVYPAIWAYFTAARFDWSPQMIGVSLGLYGISMALVQGVLIRPATSWLGERGAVIAGFGFEAVAFAILSVLASGTIALILIPVTALGALVQPAITAILSRRVDASRQGELQGVMASLHALSMILSPLGMGVVFAAFTREAAPIHLPGAPFLVALVLMLFALVLFLRAGRSVT
ncbi:TCR/Tet family MFS transporter [Lutimaribacter marinistellae]|uniref:TCR/Tet family MFS transporter n=1 Tax=Lutimaribacter marinistellae TaxID=1820329 RepID=A0ABV7TKS1_9RHOB